MKVCRLDCHQKWITAKSRHQFKASIFKAKAYKMAVAFKDKKYWLTHCLITYCQLNNSTDFHQILHYINLKAFKDQRSGPHTSLMIVSMQKMLQQTITSTSAGCKWRIKLNACHQLLLIRTNKTTKQSTPSNNNSLTAVENNVHKLTQLCLHRNTQAGRQTSSSIVGKKWAGQQLGSCSFSTHRQISNMCSAFKLLPLNVPQMG